MLNSDSNKTNDNVSKDEFRIEKATREDIPKILNFLNSDFLLNEPLNVALGIEVKDANDFFEEIINASLITPLSYVVRNFANEIIAVRLASIVHRPKTITADDLSFDSKNKNVQRMRPIQQLLHYLENQTWSLVPEEIHTLLNWLILSVHSQYTRRGIAQSLIDYNWEEVRAFGCQGFITEATAFNSQQLFKRNGYQRIYVIELNKWTDEKGQVIFQCKDSTRLATLEYLPLPKP